MFQCLPLTFTFNFQEVLILFFAGPLSGVIENRCAANTSTTTKPIRARVKEWFFKVFRKVILCSNTFTSVCTKKCKKKFYVQLLNYSILLKARGILRVLRDLALSRAEICVANFIPPCEWCKSGYRSNKNKIIKT